MAYFFGVIMEDGGKMEVCEHRHKRYCVSTIQRAAVTATSVENPSVAMPDASTEILKLAVSR